MVFVVLCVSVVDLDILARQSTIMIYSLISMKPLAASPDYIFLHPTASRPLCAPPPHTATFGYYTNMFQQIEFIIYTNIQPLWIFFLPKFKVKVKNSKK